MIVWATLRLLVNPGEFQRQPEVQSLLWLSVSPVAVCGLHLPVTLEGPSLCCVPFSTHCPCHHPTTAE